MLGSGGGQVWGLLDAAVGCRCCACPRLCVSSRRPETRTCAGQCARWGGHRGRVGCGGRARAVRSRGASERAEGAARMAYLARHVAGYRRCKG